MKITYDGVIVPKAPADMLADAETRLARSYAVGVGRESPERQSLEAERDLYRREVDAEILERWENLHAAYWRHRRSLAEHERAVAQHEDAMRKLAPEYCRAVWRSRRRYDAEAEQAWSPNGHDAERGEEALATIHET